MTKKCMLLILDGWGIAENKQYSSIDCATTPYLDSLYADFPNSKLTASGEAVGLPKDQMGNSEVGHLTIGSGRVTKQSLSRINNSINTGDFYRNAILKKTFNYAKSNNKDIHIIGLLSDGGIHSHIQHAMALCTMADNLGIENIFLHAITDGRDSAPGSYSTFLQQMNDHMLHTAGSLASIVGRYYAMDRDNKWERTAIAYNAYVHGNAILCKNIESAQKNIATSGTTDEFLLPILLLQKNGERKTIKQGDVVIAFNFRADRMRQLTSALTQESIPMCNTTPLPLYYTSMTEYNPTFLRLNVAFAPLQIPNTLGQILARNNKSQLRISETEKYPHIAYFLSGGLEEPVSRETRVVCPSPLVSTYDQVPEMAARDIAKKLVNALKTDIPDFVCVNFANADMVGHTGNFQATIKACEVIDECLHQIIPKALELDYTVLIISDHGNADKMINTDGSLHTSHTTSKVPCLLIDKENQTKLVDGTLADVAPTILKIMNIEKPTEMTGVSIASFC